MRQTARVKTSDTLRLQREGVRWELHQQFAPLLETVLTAPERLIKESPAKRVTTCAAGGQTYYVKRYRYVGQPARSFQYFFRPSPSWQEWLLAGQLEARGVPVVRHVAVGQRWGWLGLRESFLITEGFDGQPVEARTPEEAAAVAAFVERMHAAGVLQRDLHGANLLRHPTTGEMRLVDVYGIVLRSHLSAAEREQNLAFLRATLPVPVPPAILDQSRSIRRDLLVHRSKRVWKHNREFAPLRAGRLGWQIRLPLCTEAVRTLLQDPDGWLARRAQLLKAGHSATVGRADGLVLKRYNVSKPLNPLKDLFRHSRAWRAFRLAYHLELVQIPTARPVAAGQRRRLGLPTTGYYLMEEIPGARTLDQWTGAPEEVLPAAARLLGRLHEEGFYHRDLKASNLVLDAQGRLFLIDLEGLHYVGVVSENRIREDLERLRRSLQAHPRFGSLWVTRFLRHYRRARRRLASADAAVSCIAKGSTL